MLALLASALVPSVVVAFLPGGLVLGARPRADHRGRWAMQQSPSPGDNDLANSVLSKLCPLLKVVANSDPTAPRNQQLETALSGFSSISRLPWGAEVAPEVAAAAVRLEKPIVIYEFEACPFCRRVRELVTYLDLEVEVRPCPKGSIRHRNEVASLGGKQLFPYMIDENTGTSLYESADIANYLLATYGQGASFPPLLLESTLLTGWVPTLLRAGRGMSRWEGAVKEAPAAPLQLWNYENNQFCRLVREAMCELELPFVVKSAGKGSSRRAELLELAGATKCPFLFDPNTGEKVGDSGAIMEYLFKTYSSPVAV